MAQIAPFRALRYNPRQVNLSDVVTQPYDKITPEMQERYYAASPYNLVRIILGKRANADGPDENSYTRAESFFREWRQNGIFVKDAEPSIYRYVQSFNRPGSKQQLQRSGFIALGKIEDYPANVVFRHEQTLAKPKADRLELLRATRAHFGQLFMLYGDPATEIDQWLTISTEPEIDIADEYGVRHCVWKISDPHVINRVQSAMASKQLVIADGHHRYETALNYRNERRTTAAAVGSHNGETQTTQQGTSSTMAPYEMVMMTFINMDNPGIVILPTHRLVHGLPSFSPESFREGARRFFSVEEVDPSIDQHRATVILREAGHSGTALLAVMPDRAFLLDTPRANDSETFAGLSVQQQFLDVVQLHKCLLERVLGISEEAIREQRNISYVREINEALTRVRQRQADVAFLMNPVRMQQVRDIALAGEVLPQKSTDFYPKLLSGLTVYALE
ncbi:MAG: DUF1015 domain-containing protein [Acidobacteriaceae bacterium]|nr:DUF1015 domain-containing protein [Acidobacteriaceae bacterium]